MALKRALTAVLCVALGAATGSCAGGPTSDWPDHADDDDQKPDEQEPPRGGIDAGAGTSFMDAGGHPSTEVGDGGDAGVGDAGADGAVASLDAGLDGGEQTDATLSEDASGSDAESSP